MLTEERKIYYEAIRKKKLEKYMKENKDRIAAMMDTPRNKFLFFT
jgi:hypothetical protein